MSTSGRLSLAAGPLAAAARARHRSRWAPASHFGGPPADHLAFGYSGTAKGALRQLDDGHDAWVSDVRSLGAAGIARPQGAMSPPEYADAPIAKLILYTNLEVIHHGAEICLLRDLYLWKGSRDGL